MTHYILERKIKHSAFEIIHTNDNIFDISNKYGFSNPDTFTKAFKRITGVTPKEFKKNRYQAGSSILIENVFGVNTIFHNRKEYQYMNKNNDSAVLYGVPKVCFGNENTPYISCIKSVANYLGEDINYDNTLAAWIFMMFCQEYGSR